MLKKYLNHLKNRKSVNTLLNYQIAIKQFKLKYSTANLLTYTKQLLKKYEVASIQTKLAALKSFAKFSKIKANWERIIELVPKVQKKFFTTLNEEELIKLKEIRTEKNENIWKRNNLILDFLFYTGIRVSELLNLKHSDWGDNSLKILGKGNKVRYIFLPPNLVKVINPYSKDYLFTTERGRKLPREWVYQIIRERTLKAGIKKKITPHTFRRSFATLLNNRKCNLTTIQKLLGHSHITTTANYIHNDYETLYQDYSRLWNQSNYGIPKWTTPT